MKSNKAVFGIFKSRYQIERAVDALKAAGYRHSDISVLMPEMGDTRTFAHEKDTKAPEGATTGAAAGLAVGGGLGWLVGIGSLAIPGIGPFVAAGPIMAALAGAGVGGVIGGVTGALVGMGIPEYEAKRYESSLKSGGMLLSVHADDSDWVTKAKEILEAHDATDISSSEEAKGDFKPSHRDQKSTDLRY